MYKRLISFFFISMSVLLGACKQTQYDLPEVTATPVVEATNAPTVEATSTPEPRATAAPEPSMTAMPTREAVPEEKTTAVPTREEFFEESVTRYPVVTREPIGTFVPIAPSLSPTPEPLLEEIPEIEGTFVADENGVVIENEWYRVKIVSLEENEQSEYVLCVQLENKSDRELVAYATNHAVNGTEIYGWGCLEAFPGQSITEEIVYTRKELEEIGVTDITGVMFEMKIRDEVSRPMQQVVTGNVYYYPQGEAAYVPYHHVMEEDDVFIGADEGFHMIVTDVRCDEEQGYIVEAYFENKLDCPIMIHLDDVVVNGFQLEPWRYRTRSMGANRSGYGEFSLGYYVWDAFHIQEITELSFSVAVWSEEWDQYAVWEEPFTLYPLGKDAAKSYEFVPDEDDITVFDTKECRMVIIDMDTEYGEPVATVYLENKTEKELQFVCEGLWQDIWSDWQTWYSDDSWYTNLEAGRRLITELEVCDRNVMETEEGVIHTLLTTVSCKEEDEETILLQEEAELFVRNTEGEKEE